jgi:hypothetical protein
MTDEMERLSDRVDKLETSWMAEIKAIHQKLEQLAISAAQRRDCPSPGMCLVLQERIREIESAQRDFAKSLLDLQKWQAWIMGGIAILAVLITIFGPMLRHALGIES